MVIIINMDILDGFIKEHKQFIKENKKTCHHLSFSSLQHDDSSIPQCDKNRDIKIFKDKHITTTVQKYFDFFLIE